MMDDNRLNPVRAFLGAIALGASGALDSGPSFRAAQRSLPKSWRQLVNALMITHSKRNPKPEAMFAPMIKSGELKIVRRRFKPPLLVRIKPKRRATTPAGH